MLGCTLSQCAFTITLPQRLPAGVSVYIILFIRYAATQMSSAHRRATGVNTQTHHYVISWLPYRRKKAERCRKEKGLSQKYGTGNQKWVRVSGINSSIGSTQAYQDVCIA